VRFEVEGISEQAPSRQPNQLQEALVLPRKKDLDILRTVKKKASKTFSLQPDFVPGKGEGQIFLLYGKWPRGVAMKLANHSFQGLLEVGKL